MHKSFKIEKRSLEKLINDNESVFNRFEDSHLTYMTRVDEERLDRMIFEAANGKINADEIIKAYFPSMTPHIFISHSSKDKRPAIKFANYLFYTYGITSFIDSQIWGHINHAIKILNDKYSKIREEGDSITYSHKKANIISSNIYAMLTIALINTMDNSDSLILLESENSVGGDKYDVEKILDRTYETESPWIYSEVNFSRLLKPKKHARPDLLAYDGSEAFVAHEKRGQISLEEQASFVYEADLEHMLSVPECNLLKIKDIKATGHTIVNLDNIYTLFEARQLL
ncbi:TPA: hypothetical protein ACXEMW_003710 [Proteus mirabilis]